MINQTNEDIKRFAKNGQKAPVSSTCSDKTFCFDKQVGLCWDSTIPIRFETLIEQASERPFDWYKKVEIDKADASRIRRGLVIPSEWLRIKIAQHFKTDSTTIWKADVILKYEQSEAEAKASAEPEEVEE